MARLGELLIGAGLLSTEQLEQALRAQVMWGGRIGTNLVELGAVDLDAIAKALGQQHRMPAALGKHFEKVDRELQKLLSQDVAEKFLVVPLARIGPERSVVLATVGPLAPKARAIIADELVVEPSLLVPSVAAELRVRYHLERVYQIPRDTRFLRSRGKTIPPFPTFGTLSPPISEPEVSAARIQLELAKEQEDSQPIPVVRAPEPPPEPPAPEPEPEGDDFEGELPSFTSDVEAVDSDRELTEEEEAKAKERRTYVPTIAEPVDPEKKLGRVSLVRRKAIPVTSAPPVEKPVTAIPATLGEATRLIRRAASRDLVAEIGMKTIKQFYPTCDAALFLILRGEVAIGWKGFTRGGAEVPQLAVPLDQESGVTNAIKCSSVVRGADGNQIDDRLIVALGGNGELVCVPVAIAGQVMCVIASVVTDNSSATVLEAIAAATGAAFARLMRDASR